MWKRYRILLLAVGCVMFVKFIVESCMFTQNSVILLSHEDDVQVSSIHRMKSLVNNVSSLPPVLVIAYQRTGSTFLAGIFSHHPGVFLWFEPLDGVYAELYGAKQGWSVPIDLYAHRNGSNREVPDYEYDAVVGHLGHLMNGEYSKLPEEMLGHKFNWGFREITNDLENFRQCLAKYNKTTSNVCTQLSTTCPNRFGSNLERSGRCHALLHDKDLLLLNGTTAEIRSVIGYKECIKAQHKYTVKCLAELSTNERVTVVKSVRARMFHVEGLMRHVPSLRVIHMFRDPRPVVPSRKSYGVTSLYGKGDLWKEAELYCKQLNEDILLRKSLEQRYPGRFLEVIFKDLATEPLSLAHKVVEFLGLQWNDNLDLWLQQHTTGNNKKTGGVARNSAKVVDKWRRKMSNDTIIQINNVCQNLYENVGNIWPLMDI